MLNFPTQLRAKDAMELHCSIFVNAVINSEFAYISANSMDGAVLPRHGYENEAQVTGLDYHPIMHVRILD